MNLRQLGEVVIGVPGLIAVVFVPMWLATNWERESEVILDPHGKELQLVERTWWGLKREYKDLEWRRVPGFERESWAYRGEDGKWRRLGFVTYGAPGPDYSPSGPP